MTILPGSMDYLYYNGILDHIPYEVYETTMPVMNGSQYLNMAQQGNMYNTYASDTFVKRNNNTESGNYEVSGHAFGDGEGIGSAYDMKKNCFGDGDSGRDTDMEVMVNGNEGKNLRQFVLNFSKSTKDKIANSSNMVKGVLSAGIIAITAAVLFRGKGSRGGKKIKLGIKKS